VVITSYGFATIIPSLRCYFHNDVRKLRKVILLGSFIPLACYILWVGAIFGALPYSGTNGLSSVSHAEHSTLALTQSLIYYLHSQWITGLTRIFTSICVATSFLGVSLCVVDFLADGLGLEKSGGKNLLIHGLTFIPPLVIALLYPTAFIVGLSYAGICIAVLVILLPALMVWNGRYRRKMATGYQVMGGRWPLIAVMLVALGVIAQGLFWHG